MNLAAADLNSLVAHTIVFGTPKRCCTRVSWLHLASIKSKAHSRQQRWRPGSWALPRRIGDSWPKVASRWSTRKPKTFLFPQSLSVSCWRRRRWWGVRYNSSWNCRRRSWSMHRVGHLQWVQLLMMGCFMTDNGGNVTRISILMDGGHCLRLWVWWRGWANRTRSSVFVVREECLVWEENRKGYCWRHTFEVISSVVFEFQNKFVLTLKELRAESLMETPRVWYSQIIEDRSNYRSSNSWRLLFKSSV